MKINRIELIKLSVPKKTPITLPSGKRSQTIKRMATKPNAFDIIVAKVHTDENITGLGEIPSQPPGTRETPDEIFTFVKSYLGPRILGHDPFNIEKIWDVMKKTSHVGVCVKGLIDMALYDIKGKALKTPVYNLLGGLTKEKFPLVRTIYRDKPEEMAKRAKEMADLGYIGSLVKVGQPGKTDIEALKKIREQVGWDFEIRVDANGAWIVSKAIRHIKAMEKYDIGFVEQPVVWYNPRGLAAVAKKVDVPIAPHQSMYTLQDIDSLIELGGLGAMGVKVYRPIGGLTGAMKTLVIAERMNIPCYLHSVKEAGISTAASAHLVAAQYNHFAYTPEITGMYQYESELVKNPVKIEGGFAEVPKVPGLGVELDEEAVKKYKVETAIIK